MSPAASEAHAHGVVISWEGGTVERSARSVWLALLVAVLLLGLILVSACAEDSATTSAESYQDIPISDLTASADDYKGKQVTYTGRVVVIQFPEETQSGDGQYGLILSIQDDTHVLESGQLPLYVAYSGQTEAFISDTVTVRGVVYGNFEYKSKSATIRTTTMPRVDADSIEIIKDPAGTERSSAPAATGGTTVPGQPTRGSNWLHFGVDSQFSSYNPNETQIGRENVADLKEILGMGRDDAVFTVIGGTPALYQGDLILTYAGGRLELGDPYTGKMAWSFGENAFSWAPSPVVSSDGVIYYLYVTSGASSKLYAVDAETGQQIWEAATQFSTGFNFEAQVTVDEKNNLVYVMDGIFGDGRLCAVNRSSGEVEWWLGDQQQKQDEISFAGPIVPLKEGKLYVPASVPAERFKVSQMVRIDPLSRQVDMYYDRPQDADSSWEVGWYGMCSGYLLETYQNSSTREATVLVAHALEQPGIAWQTTIPPQTGRLACDPQQDIVYVPTEEGLRALEAETGRIIWDHKTLNSVFTPTIANGVIYYMSDTNMYALDQENGEQLFRFPLGVKADPSTGVAVNDGLVVFSGSGGECDLFVLGLK